MIGLSRSFPSFKRCWMGDRESSGGTLWIAILCCWIGWHVCCGIQSYGESYGVSPSSLFRLRTCRCGCLHCFCRLFSSFYDCKRSSFGSMMAVGGCVIDGRPIYAICGGIAIIMIIPKSFVDPSEQPHFLVIYHNLMTVARWECGMVGSSCLIGCLGCGFKITEWHNGQIETVTF